MSTEAADSEPRGEGDDSELSPEVEWTPNYPVIRKLDEWWFKAERIVCGVMFLVMALLVFAAVVSDIFGIRRQGIDLVVLFGLVYLAIRTRELREGETRPSHPVTLALAAVITAAIAGAVYLYVKRYPGGFVFAQKLALVMMLWVALLGASMATYERTHLALEMGEMVWPRRLLHLVRAFAHAVTSAFCIGLLMLSVNMVQQNMDTGEVIRGLEWMPLWLAVSIMPYTFAAMAVRLLAQSFTVATRSAKPQEEQLPT